MDSATATNQQATLASSAWSGLMWNYLGVAARFVSSFVIGVVLARLLDPKPFGQVAITWIVIGLGNLVADFGFGAALVQRQEISKESIRFVFTVQMAIGAAMTALVIALAPLLASLFGQPEVTPVLRALAWIFL